MTPELKQKWVTALRSDDYSQGKGILRDDKDNFCCLGVLCEISGLKSVKVFENDTFYYYESKDKRCCTSLPWQLAEELDISSHTLNHLVGMNDGMKDGRQYSFTEIADWIEENL